MTDDLLDAARATVVHSSSVAKVIAALRAVENPSPAAVEAMREQAYYAFMEQSDDWHNPDFWQNIVVAAWRAGIGAIVGGEG